MTAKKKKVKKYQNPLAAKVATNKKAAISEKVTTQSKKYYTTYIPSVDDSVGDVINDVGITNMQTTRSKLDQQALEHSDFNYCDDKPEFYYEIEVVVNVSGPKKLPESKTKANKKIVW